MKREVLIDGRPVRLTWEGGRLEFRTEGGEPVQTRCSISELAPGTYSVLLGNRSYTVAVGRDGEFVVDGRRMQIETFDPRDRRAGSGAVSKEGRQQVKAPMPGKVVRVLAAVGDAVDEGQGLVVVEAMKMQNEMKSPKAGRVVEIRTRADATVTAGDVLVVVE